MRPNRKNERGNVFIIILIAIALFGALIFTFSRNGQQSISSVSKQEAKIVAQEILNYARLVEGAVNRVRRNGCSESEISFENDVVSVYTNPNSPPDKSCHIFDSAGGKLTWTNPPAPFYYNDPLHYLGKYFFIDTQWIGHGCDDATDQCNDLIMALVLSDENTCKEINIAVGMAPTIIEATNGGNIFQGSFTHGPTYIYGDEVTSVSMVGQSTACITKGAQYGFTHVLLAR